MEAYSHQWYTEGDAHITESLELLKDQYGFTGNNHKLLLKKPDYFMSFDYDAHFGNFEILLRDHSSEFVPDKTRLEHRIIAHFLAVAGTQGFRDGLHKPVDSELFQALTECYSGPQAPSP